MQTKPRLKYCDHFGNPRSLEYSELIALQREVEAEADATPPMRMVMTKGSTSSQMEALGEGIVNAVRSFVAKKLAPLEARIAALEAKQ